MSNIAYCLRVPENLRNPTGRDFDQDNQSRKTNITDRPHWWTLLAITIALMALIVAISSTHNTQITKHESATNVLSSRTSRPGNSTFSRSLIKSGPPTRKTAKLSSSPKTNTRINNELNQTASNAYPSSNLSSGSLFGGNVPGDIHSQPTSNISSLPTSTAPEPSSPNPTTSVPPISTSTTIQSTSSSTTSTTSTTSATNNGYLQYPDNISASYQVQGAASEKATATWSGSINLTLSISCPGGSQTLTGASGISVSASSEQQQCSVTLSEPTGYTNTTPYPYTITLGSPS